MFEQISAEQELTVQQTVTVKKMMALYTIHTRGSVELVYTNVAEEDKEELIRKMQHRLNFYISVHTGIDFLRCRQLTTLEQDEMKIVYGILDSIDSFEDVRVWWYTSGRDNFYAYREARRAAERLKTVRKVVRLNDTGFMKMNPDDNTQWLLVQRPQDATWFAGETTDEELTEWFKELGDLKIVSIGLDKLEGK